MNRPANLKFLSVVTISYNQKDYLRQTLDSVISQKEEDVEYIVVDPGSTDGSREILQEYSGDIDRLILEPDDGPADGLNKGFAQAKGQYFFFINSDDFLMPRAIETMRETVAASGYCDLLNCSAWIVDGDGAPLSIARPVHLDIKSLLNGRANMVQHGLLFAHSLYAKTGGFNCDNHTCWDLELLLDMLAEQPSIQLGDRRIAAFRIHGESLTGGVSGTAHEQRYQSDLRRLRERFEVTEKSESSFGSRFLKVVQKHLLAPGWTLRRMADRTFPRMVAKEWAKDNHT